VRRPQAGGDKCAHGQERNCQKKSRAIAHVTINSSPPTRRPTSAFFRPTDSLRGNAC
jgi:hypothetical protein